MKITGWYKVITQIYQQLTSTDLLEWIIVDYIDVGWNSPSHEKIVIIHACIGTVDHRVKTFFMQDTGSRICYLSLRKWCFGCFSPECCLIFQPVSNFSYGYVTLHISMRAMMRWHSNYWQECLVTPCPHLTCLFLSQKHFKNFICRLWLVLPFDFNLIDNW